MEKSDTGIIYKGGWQFGKTIRQCLEGPKGSGEVVYPNGDRFRGMFHLNYASINGPAYAASGRYDFADGSYIGRAWINTSSDRTVFDLHGVFRIVHPQEPDSIAMFNGNKRYGFELFLDEEKPWVREWYDGKPLDNGKSPYEVEDYTLDETSSEDCTLLKLTLRKGHLVWRVEQQGGRYETNQYDQSVYAPYTHVTIRLPNGDSMDHYGCAMRGFEPVDGYVDMHCAETGLWRSELWENGTLKKAEEWKRDRRAARAVRLPDPSGAEGELSAYVWADGHISYQYDEWVYDGETSNDRPEGQGVLTGDKSHSNRRYEGTFREGRYAGEETSVPSEVTLHARHGHSHWSVGSSGEWKYEESDFTACLGRLSFAGFRAYEIIRITPDCITIGHYGETCELRPDAPLSLTSSIEGREWSDGCVYDGDDYRLILTFKH